MLAAGKRRVCCFDLSGFYSKSLSAPKAAGLKRSHSLRSAALLARNTNVAAPLIVCDLVERFEQQGDAYKSGAYNEAQLRQEFIDPMFEALGWDMQNKSGYAEAYKDVIHEDAIKIGGATKAPDYCFRIGGTRKFFLEAKKPSVDIKTDASPAYQLRRYAWSAKLPLSILTDFEGFAVYDCRIEPKLADKASVARVLYLNFREYPPSWDDIAKVFARDAILKGSFDKFAESNKAKRGTAEVDDAFLYEIEHWRADLARNLALRNPELTQRDLNFAVQRTIDRIIFLRICEDRRIEVYGRLQALLNGEHTYDRLKHLYREADERYNSGLFHFRKEKDRIEPPDDLTPRLEIDDAVLKRIIRRLYYPESPYEFSVLPADILGQVYEQFLGKVIRLTEGHQARVEDKPEVKKAGGVYYTPTYIVDYIVRNTLGKLLDGKSPKQAARLRILDPACGSGSFLIGAYQHLLDWHRDWYVADGAKKWSVGKKPTIYQASSDAWKLTTTERKRILLQNIYGVDIDAQAVETTKLSLLLKVLEGESEGSLATQLRFYHERALPDLGRNIKCGNSLIGPDFYEQTEMMLDEEERYRINVFDWQAEFREIIQAGGFDAVIGNPPYIFTREQLSDLQREYFGARYKLSWEKHNTFMLFMELMLRLLHNCGRGGFIVPNSWLTIESAQLLRSAFVPRMVSLADLNYAAFRKVSMEPCIFIAAGSAPNDYVLVTRASSKEEFLRIAPTGIGRSRWTGAGYRIVFSADDRASLLMERLEKRCSSIGEHFDVRTGLQAYERGKGNPPQSAQDVRDHVFDRAHREDEYTYRYLEGGDVGRYRVAWSGTWLRYGPWLSQPRERQIFTRPRILLREITSSFPRCLHATYLDKSFLNNKSILNVLQARDNMNRLKGLLCILNSRLISLFYKERAVKGARKIFPKVVIKNLREFPYPSVIGDVHERKFVGLANRMLELHKQLVPTKTAHEQTALQRQIDATDALIDRLVYELYGLNDDEIKIVEAALAPPATAS